MKELLQILIRPVVLPFGLAEFLLSIPRVLAGWIMAFHFGINKVPVSENFIQTIAELGFPFPEVFAWAAALAELVGGLLLLVGLNTRFASFMIFVTMMVAVFLQKWDSDLISKLPALSFLWVSIYTMVLGSGRFGIDYYLSRSSGRKRNVNDQAGMML